MPLEFALRPRLGLEPARPPRKRRKLRISPLALPMLAYWLAIGGVTRLVLRSFADEDVEGRALAAQWSSVAAGDDDERSAPNVSSSSLRAASRPQVTSSALEPRLEPVPAVQAAPEPAPAPEPKRSLAAPPELVARPAARVSEPSAPAPRIPEPALSRGRDVETHPVVGEPRANVSEQREPRRVDESESRLEKRVSGDERGASSLPSCESAAASANQSMDLRAAPGAPDLTRDAFASVLENGSYLARCAIPERTAVEICAAVQNGRVVGVTVTSSPHDGAIDACVRRSVASLRFPENPRLDVTRTRFAPAR